MHFLKLIWRCYFPVRLQIIPKRQRCFLLIYCIISLQVKCTCLSVTVNLTQSESGVALHSSVNGEVSCGYLQPWVDGKAAWSGIHAGHILHIVNLLQQQLVPVIPGGGGGYSTLSLSITTDTKLFQLGKRLRRSSWTCSSALPPAVAIWGRLPLICLPHTFIKQWLNWFKPEGCLIGLLLDIKLRRYESKKLSSLSTSDNT